MRTIRIASLAAALLLFAAFVGCAPAAQPLSDERAKELIPLAEQLVADYTSGDNAAARAVFDDKMKQALSEEKLAEGWATVSAQSGKFVSIKSSSAYVYKDLETVDLIANCETKNLAFRVVFNKDNTVSGFWVNFAS